jgi:hypothetical protein
LIYKWVTFEDGQKMKIKINAKLYKKMRWFV